MARRPVHEGLFEEHDGRVHLLGDRCGACGRHQFPRAHTCTLCGAPDPEPVELTDEGALWAWTRVQLPPPGYDGPTPYGFGVVELPEGLRVVTRLVLDPDAHPPVGTPVRAVIEVVGTDEEDEADLVTWAFTPTGAAPA